MSVPANVQAAYNDLIGDKYRRNCLTIPDSEECIDCLIQQEVNYSTDIQQAVCQIPGPTSPRQSCSVKNISAITACPGGLQIPAPPGATPVNPSVTTCSENCRIENLPTCVMPNPPPLGSGHNNIVGNEYLREVSNACAGTDPNNFDYWSPSLECKMAYGQNYFPDNYSLFQCEDAQWGVQVTNNGDPWGGTDTCVGMNSNDQQCSNRSRGGTCSDRCLSNVFLNNKLYDSSGMPTGNRTTVRGGDGSVYRTVKMPIDEIKFDGDTIERDCTDIDLGKFKCRQKAGRGYATIMCNGKEQRIPVGKFSCPEVDCDVETVGHRNNSTFSRCYCNRHAPSLPGIPNMVGKYIIGKLSLPNAQQGQNKVNWYTCTDQRLATDRRVDQYIGDDDKPNII
jgi:hypothetical protein